MAEYYLTGNSIRFIATFKGFDGEVIYPEQVTFSIYDYKWGLLDQFSLTSENRNTEGAYVFDYVFSQVGKYFYEFRGETAGSPVLDRDEINIRKI